MLKRPGPLILAAFFWGLLAHSSLADPECPPPTTGWPLDDTQNLHLPKQLSAAASRYQRYLEDTYNGLDLLRGANGLIQESADVLPDRKNQPVKLKITKSETSPTNIGLDLLAQASFALQRGPHQEHAMAVMKQILTTLSREPTYQNSGLFFSWYATQGIKATNRDVSSVDNIHLALALWTLSRKLSGTAVGEQAKSLFEKMDFSAFYDPLNGLIHGNISYQAPNHWRVDDYDYKYYGAEARSIYAVGYALGLFKQQAGDPDFIRRAVKNLDMERYPDSHGNILRAWDGGGFQILLPEVLLNEDVYSPALKESAAAYSSFITDEGRRLDLDIPGKNGEYFPALFSANPQGKDSEGHNVYAAQSGNVPLIAIHHEDYCDPARKKIWSRAITVHVGMMAASVDAGHGDQLSHSLDQLEHYSSEGVRLYHEGLGFSDGVITEKGRNYGKVISQVSALDQLFFLTAAARATDPSGNGISADALTEDARVREKLNDFYEKVDEKLSAVVPSQLPVQCPSH